jgi:Holliday junction resolvase RusA-like endonuclease
MDLREAFYCTPKLPFPPSVNKAYFVHHGRLKLREFGRKYKEKLTHLLSVDMQENQVTEIPEDARFVFVVRLYTSLYTKQGKVKRIDTDNRVKLLKDAVFTTLGVDDKMVFGDVVFKYDSDEDYVEVDICPYSRFDEP